MAVWLTWPDTEGDACEPYPAASYPVPIDVAVYRRQPEVQDHAKRMPRQDAMPATQHDLMPLPSNEEHT